MAKKKNLKLNLALLYIFSFLVSVAPLIIVLVIKWDTYTKTPSDTVKLCLGGGLCVVLIALKTLDKLHAPNKIVSSSIVFVLIYLLQAVLNDLLLLSGMFLLGEAVDLICFQRPIKTTKENILIGRTANATTEQVKEVLQTYFNGRT